jgi:hypothetical protein
LDKKAILDHSERAVGGDATRNLPFFKVRRRRFRIPRLGENMVPIQLDGVLKTMHAFAEFGLLRRELISREQRRSLAVLLRSASPRP